MSPELCISLLQRDFTATMAQPAVRYALEQFETRDIWGPRSAVIRADGDLQALDQLVTRLRCPVDIVDRRERPAWYGFVNEVRVVAGSVEYGVTLDRMANRVRISYSRTDAGEAGVSAHAWTDWAEAGDSIAIYGYREIVETLSQATLAAAETRRDELLAERRAPRRLLDARGAGARMQPYARLACRGWGDTAGWRYYSNAATNITYSPQGGELHMLADRRAHLAYAQSFVTPSTIYGEISGVRIPVGRTNTLPGAGLICQLCANSGTGDGVPGTVLTSGSLPVSEFTTDVHKHLFAFTSRYLPAASTRYWLKLWRTDGGRQDPGYYRIRYIPDSSGYPDGVLRCYNGYTGVWGDGDGDLKFDIVIDRETSVQIVEIATAACQFITGTQVDTASGLYSTPGRSGEKTAAAYLEELFQQGVSGSRRYIAQVERSRRLHVYREPEAGVADYTLLASGALLDPLKNVVEPYLAPPGVWVWVDAVPDTSNVTAIAQTKRIYAEGWRYSASGNRTTPIARDATDPRDITTWGART